jgi:ornithine cyclodeaminase/alanine dehydrogenase-like protein (mu-crystallin family)
MKRNQIETLKLRTLSEPHDVRAPGRVVHDIRGNAVWDWAVSTAVLANKTVAELVMTLDVPSLALGAARAPGALSAP